MQRFLARQISPFLRSGPLPASSSSALTSSKFARLLPFVEQTADDRHRAEVDDHKQLIQALVNTPIFTPAAEKYVDAQIPREDLPKGTDINLIPQYGLMGIRHDDARPGGHAGAVADDADAPPEDRLVLANYNLPWSAFICGSQGAGKSHTLSCMLENLLSRNPAGELPHPLTGLVMHYDNFTNSSTTQLCETAYLCSSGIPVRVLVSPSNIWAMKRQYATLPGLPPGSPLPKVYPLYLSDHHMTITRMLKLMAYNPAAKDGPLYMEVVMSIIRDMAMEGPGFDYTRFRRRLDKQKWDPAQKSSLNLRLKLLDGFMTPSDANSLHPRPAPASEDIWSFEPGTLTIIDLSDPFVSSDSACTLFSIALSIFLEDRHKCGRVVAMDEAHKFLSQSGEARILTQDLMSTIRQQRHTGTRVLIATQEPTLGPELIDLANATFVHRFLSPAWYHVLSKHLAGANKMDSARPGSLFDTIVKLRTGEALLFCPTAQIDVNKSTKSMALTPLGNDYLKIKIRKRVTADGGKSIMASDATVDLAANLAAQKARQARESAAAEQASNNTVGQMGVPMFKPKHVREEENRAARREVEGRRRLERARVEVERRAMEKAARDAKLAARIAAREAKQAERGSAKEKRREELEKRVAGYRREGRRIYGEFFWEDALVCESRLALDGTRPFAADPADYGSFEPMTPEERWSLEVADMSSSRYESLLRKEEDEYMEKVLREDLRNMEAEAVREQFMRGGEDDSFASTPGNDDDDDEEEGGLGFGDEDDDGDDGYGGDDISVGDNGDDNFDDDNFDYDDDDLDNNGMYDDLDEDGDSLDDLSLTPATKETRIEGMRQFGLIPIDLKEKKAERLYKVTDGSYVTFRDVVDTTQEMFQSWWSLNGRRMPQKPDFVKLYQAVDQTLGTRVSKEKKLIVELNATMQNHLYKLSKDDKHQTVKRQLPKQQKKKKKKKK